MSFIIIISTFVMRLLLTGTEDTGATIVLWLKNNEKNNIKGK